MNSRNSTSLKPAGAFGVFGFSSVHLMGPRGTFSTNASTSATLEGISTNDVENLNNWRACCARECAWALFWCLVCKQNFAALIKPERPSASSPLLGILFILFIIFLLSVRNLRIIKPTENVMQTGKLHLIIGTRPIPPSLSVQVFMHYLLGKKGKGYYAMQMISMQIMDPPPYRAPGGNLAILAAFAWWSGLTLERENLDNPRPTSITWLQRPMYSQKNFASQRCWICVAGKTNTK